MRSTTRRYSLTIEMRPTGARRPCGRSDRGTPGGRRAAPSARRRWRRRRPASTGWPRRRGAAAPGRRASRAPGPRSPTVQGHRRSIAGRRRQSGRATMRKPGRRRREAHVNLQGKAALITGGARMGDAVAAVLAEGGADVSFTYRMSPDAAERAAAVVRAARPSRLHVARRPRRSARLPDHGQRSRRGLRPARRPGEHGVVLQARAVRRPGRGSLGPPAVGGSAGRVPVQPGGGAAHAASGRRAHRQLLGLDRGQRPAALSGLRRLLRGQGRREGADRGARPRTGRPTRFSSTRSRPGRLSRRRARPPTSTPRSSGRRRWAGGAARTKSPRRWRSW